MKLKIIIEGPCKSGKSTVAFAIKDLLKINNIQCDVSGAEDEYPGYMEKNWKKRFSQLKNIKVDIETRRVKR